jgi:malate dehydrogenase
MGKSSAASAANAACDHIHDLWFGTLPGHYVSMGVNSDGNLYGVPEGVNFSFPVEILPGGNWRVVNGLSINDFARARLTKTGAELLEERKMALGF